MTAPKDAPPSPMTDDTIEDATPRSFAAQVALLSRLLRKRFYERARAVTLEGEEALTQAQWRALATIHLNPGSTQKELAERLEIGPVAIGQTVDRLERLKWVERQNDPTDRRVNRLHATREALPTLQRLGLSADSEHPYASVNLPPEKMRQLMALLDEVIADLSSSS